MASRYPCRSYGWRLKKSTPCLNFLELGPRFCHHPISPPKNNKTSTKALNILTCPKVIRKHSDQFEAISSDRVTKVWWCLFRMPDAFRSGCNRGLPESLIQGAGKFEPYAAKKQVDFSAEFHTWRCLLSDSLVDLSILASSLPEISTVNPCKSELSTAKDEAPTVCPATVLGCLTLTQ